MKKYLMIGFAAIAFASCSNHDFETMTQEQIIKAEYKAKFVNEFGQPASNQTWGFGTSTRAFTRSGNMDGKTPVAATSTGINANANEWADPEKEFGGWIVPDELTATQKEIVMKYFQNVTPLDYVDPQWNNFFVQQVYTGGTSKPSTGNGEVTLAADGTEYTSANMNLLTVGENEQHINNFNRGGYSSTNNPTEGSIDGSVQVLDNGQSVGGSSHPDQIMLMVNIDDTGCMGYHNSGASIQRNDKAAIVSWQTIATWAKSNGYPNAEEILNDGWDRSFVGFDFELLPLDQVTVADTYAQLSNITGNMPKYVTLDGETVMILGGDDETGGKKDFLSGLSTPSWDTSVSSTIEDGKVIFTNNNEWGGSIEAAFSQEDFSGYEKIVFNLESNPAGEVEVSFYGMAADNSTKTVLSKTVTLSENNGKVEIDITDMNKADCKKVEKIVFKANTKGTYTITEAYLETSGSTMAHYTSTYILGGTNNDEKIQFYIENTNMFCGETRHITEDDMRITVNGYECLNIKLFADLYAEGFHPTSSTLKDWAKWSGGDGYYSDWIVTLHEAQRIVTEEFPDPEGRIMAEDLTVNNDPTGKKSDWDFNDVVFDWAIQNGKAYITLQAAGGTLPLTIGGELVDGEVVGGVEVHKKFGVSTGTMVNTGLATKDPVKFILQGEHNTYNDGDAGAIKLHVYKGGQWVEIEAEQGEPAGKFNCEADTKWCDEYVNIKRVYPQFAAWVGNPAVTWTTIADGKEILVDKYLENNDDVE